MSTPDTDRLADALSRLANGEVPAGDSVSGDADFSTMPVEPAAQEAPPVPAESAAPTLRAPRPSIPTISPPPLPGPITAAPIAQVLPDDPVPVVPVETVASDSTANTDPSTRVEPLVSDDVNLPGDFSPGTVAVAPAAAPPIEVFRPVPHRPHARAALYQTLEFRRTVIPVLLVSGVLLIILGLAAYIVSPTSPLSALPVWMPPTLIVFGLALLGVAALNMASVKAQTEQR